MKQILIIHGGDSFSTYSDYLHALKTSAIDYERLKPRQKWKQWIAEQLPDCDVLLPTFPNGYNAVYDEWVMYFEKLLPFLQDDVRLIGHSLGAMFLTKYLHDHPLQRKVRQLILVAGQYGERQNDDMGSFLVSSASGLEKSSNEIHLFYSSDDPVIDYASLDKYRKDLPNAIVHRFTNRKHFNDETFVELLEVLNQK